MAYLRFKALDQLLNRSKTSAPENNRKVSEYFGELAFTNKEMRNTLSQDLYDKVNLAIVKRNKIDPETANALAAAIKNWAIGKGATHFTHWFQPLTGSTAEKHDTFYDSILDIENLSGSELVQQEPDASSFPSGGIRTTFEARGYTAWDPGTPIFIIDTTLCIPTIFVSYTGEALDYKVPLLKSLDVLDRAATKVCRIFERQISQVTATLGWEQEYFVVDAALYAARPDLVMSGRTVYGHNPARGQQLDDHYFGSIPNRIFEFMKEFEFEAHRLGIPIRTRHNEVAPSQFEVAPMFESVNIAADHNQLVMDLMDKIAEKHNLKVLFHEKPFHELNGNGKHNNWSLRTDTGVNLLQPSNSARENLMFLTFFVNTIKAVNEHSSLLAASIVSAGNELRMGTNEAPPGVISVFVGSELSAVLDEVERNGNIKVEKGDNLYMKLGIDLIPEIILDKTDRNRTSPFAFTGNKFEFRAVGGGANICNPMTVLNLIVADQLNQFYREVIKRSDKGEDKRLAIIHVLREYIKSSKNIRFEGDGYSEEWTKEAKKRKLTVISNTPEALDPLLDKKTKELFERNKVMTARELEARYETQLENYIMKLQIEARVMGDLALNHIIPTAINFQNKLIENAKGLSGLGISNDEVVEIIQEISVYVKEIRTNVYEMIQERKRVNKITVTREKAQEYCDAIKSKYFEKIRYAVDKLEILVDNEDWPLMKYRELLFLR